MRRGIVIVLLAAGAAFGFTLGFGRLYTWHHYGYGPGWHGRRTLEDRAADACVRAADRVLTERRPGAAPPSP
jgi:hypothetical protein